MIQPSTRAEHAFVNGLAVSLVRAHEQVAAGDTPGSVAFTDAFRDLKEWGQTRHGQRTQGLAEWAELLAREELYPDPATFAPHTPGPLRRLMRAQEAAVLDADPAPDPAPIVPVKTRRTRKKKEN